MDKQRHNANIQNIHNWITNDTLCTDSVLSMGVIQEKSDDKYQLRDYCNEW
jgi:hypothetical protein